MSRVAAGVESEMELAYAGLHQLCAPILDGLERLPAPQRDALGTAFGLQAGGAPDRFLVGLAVLSLLSDVADERPLVCVVDDAQWLDKASAQVLAFVARRLVAESVAVVFAVRDSLDEHELTGMAELEVHGLVDGDAKALLESVIAGPLDVRVRDRIVAETRGNPLALLELPRGLTPAELAGGFGLPDAPALSGRIEETFRRRLTLLPAQTRGLLLIAAAEPTGDPLLLWRAAGELGIDLEAAPPAVAAGLVDFDSQVRFRHPLVRSAVYRAASPEERRDVHRALAESTDADVDPDRRAWHRAHAATAPDEDVAAELARSAGRAQARGGLAAAAAFLERAAALTPSLARRAQRALDAAQVELQAGAFGAALDLLTAAEAGPLDALQRARVDMLRAQIAFASSRRNEAARLLLAVARRLEPLDAALARETYRDAFTAAMFAGRPGRRPRPAGGRGGRSPRATLPAPATQGRHAARRPGRALHRWVRRRDANLQASAAGVLQRGHRRGGRPALALARVDHRGESVGRRDLVRPLQSPCGNRPRGRRAQRAPARAQLTRLRASVRRRAGGGRLAGGAWREPSRRRPGATSHRMAPSDSPPCRAAPARLGELIEASMSELAPRGEGIGVTVTQWANAVLCNGRGGFHDALVAAQQAAEFTA